MKASMPYTDIQRSARENITMTGEDGSAVQSQEHDNHHQMYQQKLYANAIIASSQQKSASLDNLPPSATPIFYDVFPERERLFQVKW